LLTNSGGDWETEREKREVGYENAVRTGKAFNLRETKKEKKDVVTT